MRIAEREGFDSRFHDLVIGIWHSGLPAYHDSYIAVVQVREGTGSATRTSTRSIVERSGMLHQTRQVQGDVLALVDASEQRHPIEYHTSLDQFLLHREQVLHMTNFIVVKTGPDNTIIAREVNRTAARTFSRVIHN